MSIFNLRTLDPKKLEDLTHSYFWSAARRQGISFEEYAENRLKSETHNPYIYAPTDEYEEEILTTYYEDKICLKAKPKNTFFQEPLKKLKQFLFK